MSTVETLMAVQLEQAGILFDREVRFVPSRRWRADFGVYPTTQHPVPMMRCPLLVEIEGGIGSTSRHITYTGFSKDCEKYAAAAILGYRVIRCTSRQVEDGTCLSWIRAALGLEVAA